MNTHELKCHPHFFAAIAAGKKTFEIRRNDRDYRIGDMLNLREYDPTFGMTGRRLSGLEVVYIMQAEDFPAILPGFIIMGLRGVPSMEDEREPGKDFVVCDKCGAHYQPHYGHIACGVEGTGKDGWKDDAKSVGEVVAKLPVVQQLERCNEYRKVAGLVIPRTCAECGLGPCKYPERSDNG